MTAPSGTSGAVAGEWAAGGAEGALLRVSNLRTEFRTDAGSVRAVDGVSFDVGRGEIFAIVGESGCGKTATALSILGLLPAPAGRIVGGEVRFAGEDLLGLPARRLREIRGDRIAIVFQEPNLDPVARVGDQIAEVLRAHRRMSVGDARRRAVDLLDQVGILRPQQRARDFPHQFSGGMRQRAMIAMAISLEPDLLIADEPTTALDVTIQAQILELLLEVRARMGMAIILITHDLGVVASVAQRVMVMYAGRKVEEADLVDLFGHPRHPYTQGLLASTTRLDRPRVERLSQIPGVPPSLLGLAAGCPFAPRCPHAAPVCRESRPELRPVAPRHQMSCHLGSDQWPSS